MKLLPTSVLLAVNVCLAFSAAVKSTRSGHKRFELDVTWEVRAPDGYSRPQILINGKSPGPTIQVTQGDSVEVVVNNKMQDEITVHYHGIQQQGTPWSDGVPGLSQRPIESGKSFTYKWVATQYGTYWYHAHVRGQVMDGFYGPIIIDPADDLPNPFYMISNNTEDQENLKKAELDTTPVVLSDWVHLTSEQLRDVAVSANIDTFCVDSVLINGKGSVNCQSAAFLASLVPPPILPLLGGQTLSAKGCLPLESDVFQGPTQHYYDLVPQSLWNVCNATNSPNAVIKADTHGQWMSLSFISTSSILELTFSIDQHPMWIYAVDGRYIEPVQVEAITAPHGSRYSVFIQLNQAPGNYPVRATSSGLNQKVAGLATLSYPSHSGTPTTSSAPFIDYSGANTSSAVRYNQDGAMVPFPPDPPARHADATHLLSIGRLNTTAWTWSLNGENPFGETLELEYPLLWAPATAVRSPNLTIATTNGSWVDFVLLVEPLQPSHPIHKHSNKGYLIGSGLGAFNYSTVDEAIAVIPESFNLVNPPLRDGFYTPAAAAGPSWLVIRYQVVNPGAFLLHCHINPHLQGGMALAILDGIDAFPTIPPEYGPGGMS